MFNDLLNQQFDLFDVEQQTRQLIKKIRSSVSIPGTYQNMFNDLLNGQFDIFDVEQTTNTSIVMGLTNKSGVVFGPRPRVKTMLAWGVPSP